MELPSTTPPVKKAAVASFSTAFRRVAKHSPAGNRPRLPLCLPEAMETRLGAAALVAKPQSARAASAASTSKPRTVGWMSRRHLIGTTSRSAPFPHEILPIGSTGLESGERVAPLHHNIKTLLKKTRGRSKTKDRKAIGRHQTRHKDSRPKAESRKSGSESIFSRRLYRKVGRVRSRRSGPVRGQGVQILGSL